MTEFPFVPLSGYREYPVDEMARRDLRPEVRAPGGRQKGQALLSGGVGGPRTGMLITALHMAGLATLTRTPNPMKFLNEILGRPKDAERPFLLLVVGYPEEGTRVPDIGRKPLCEVVSYV